MHPFAPYECKNIAPVVFSHNTNIVPAKNDIKAMEGSEDLALFFNNIEN